MAGLDELEEVLRSGRETRGIEFKGAMIWSDRATQGKVVRAALAMANKRDGGIITFGLERIGSQPTHETVGLSQVEYESFSQDHVSSLVNSHAMPHVDLTVEHYSFHGKRVVSITVREFADYPIICSKDFAVDGQLIVRRGKLYYRSRRMPESTEVQSPDDLREIIELATVKGLERYFRLREVERRHAQPDPAELFRKQLGDLTE